MCFHRNRWKGSCLISCSSKDVKFQAVGENTAAGNCVDRMHPITSRWSGDCVRRLFLLQPQYRMGGIRSFWRTQDSHIFFRGDIRSWTLLKHRMAHLTIIILEILRMFDKKKSWELVGRKHPNFLFIILHHKNIHFTTLNRLFVELLNPLDLQVVGRLRYEKNKRMVVWMWNFQIQISIPNSCFQRFHSPC